jgi:hypothetical protein
MGYWVTKFGTTTLSSCAPVQDVGLAQANAPGIETPNGAVDALGTGRAGVGLPYRLTVKGETVQSDFGTMKTAYYALRGLYGKRAKLYRKPDGTTATEWVNARLEAISASRDGDKQLAVPYTLQFQVYSPVWNGTGKVTSAALGTEPTTEIAVYNGGNADVRDPIITITAATGAITQVTLSANSETALHWVGTIASAQSLVIDCGARTVRNNGADAYSGVTYNAGHVVSYWLGLGATATTTLTLTRTAAGADVVGKVKITYNEGWY